MSINRARALVGVTVMAMSLSGPAMSATDGEPDHWEWGAELYFWGASLGGSTTSGGDVDIGISTIIKDLKFGAMGALAARKGNWTVFGDVIYLDLKDSGDVTVPVGPVPLPVSAKIELKGVVSTSGVGYRFYDEGNTSLDLAGGIRYLWLDATLDVTIPVLERDIREKASGSNWDGVIGIRGKTDLNDKWYLTYYADVGAGDSNLTWQALGAVNYRFKKVDLALGYRYLDWDFDKFGPFNDLNLSGAFMGVKFRF